MNGFLHVQSVRKVCNIRLPINEIYGNTFIVRMYRISAQLTTNKRLRWSRDSVLAFGTQVLGIKPGRSLRIFQGEKILSTPSFGRKIKPFIPCRIFAECKRTRKCIRGSRSFRSKLPAVSRPSSSSLHY